MHKENTNSEHYGNDTAIEDVYTDTTSPTLSELEEGLAATDLLTDKEAFAFVHGHMKQFPPLQTEEGTAQELLKNNGFDPVSEFLSVRKTAMNKIAEAIWIYELIDAYRSPETFTPENCDECGGTLGHTWVGDHRKDDSTILCLDCADIDPESRYYPFDSTADDE